MNRFTLNAIVASMVLAGAQGAVAGTDVYFNPLTQSTAVATPNHVNELNSPWQTPAGISQVNLIRLSDVESDPNQSIVRVQGLGSNASMFDMVSFDPTGKYVFIPHETQFGAGLTRYSIEQDSAEVLFSGDMSGDWSSDFGAFDPSTWSPNNTLLLGEEWSGEGRIFEVINPMADSDIQYRELNSIPNVAHEGLRFNLDGSALYFIDEWNSGSLYKFVPSVKGEYTQGQTFVLVVDAYDGIAEENWNSASNKDATRTGKATWVPLTDKEGNKLTDTDPFLNGPSIDPSNPTARGGRGAADELNGTPYGRPEDVEVGRLANGNEVLYFNATSELALYSIEEKGDGKAMVRLMASETATPKNLGYPATTGTLDSPDNLAQDALGNLYIVEDWPNNSNVGGDVWFVRDVDGDGVAESLDHFLSLQVDGAESTGMIFNPANPTQFIIAVQHPDSTDLSKVPDGYGDALWLFDISDVVAPSCVDKDDHRHGKRSGKNCRNSDDNYFVKQLKKASYNVSHDKE
jgi:hypothetical protein